MYKHLDDIKVIKTANIDLPRVNHVKSIYPLLSEGQLLCRLNKTLIPVIYPYIGKDSECVVHILVYTNHRNAV